MAVGATLSLTIAKPRDMNEREKIVYNRERRQARFDFLALWALGVGLVGDRGRRRASYQKWSTDGQMTRITVIRITSASL